MGQIQRFKEEKLVIPLLLSDTRQRSPLLDELEKHYGPIDYTSSDLPFTYTHYYYE